jgi:hypothetical protein
VIDDIGNIASSRLQADGGSMGVRPLSVMIESGGLAAHEQIGGCDVQNSEMQALPIGLNWS